MYVLSPLLFEIHVTCSGARYPMIKSHTPHRYNSIVVFKHCGVYSPYNASAPSCWNTNSVSQLEADLEVASVQQCVENCLSALRQSIRYQSGDQNLHHPYVTDIDVCTTLDRSFAQSFSRTAQDLSRTQAIRICGGQSDTRTGSCRIRRISPVGVIETVFHVRPSSVTETEQL